MKPVGVLGWMVSVGWLQGLIMNTCPFKGTRYSATLPLTSLSFHFLS